MGLGRLGLPDRLPFSKCQVKALLQVDIWFSYVVLPTIVRSVSVSSSSRFRLVSVFDRKIDAIYLLSLSLPSRLFPSGRLWLTCIRQSGLPADLSMIRILASSSAPMYMCVRSRSACAQKRVLRLLYGSVRFPNHRSCELSP